MTRMAPLLRWRKRGNVSAPSPPTFYYRRGTLAPARRWRCGFGAWLLTLTSVGIERGAQRETGIGTGD